MNLCWLLLFAMLATTQAQTPGSYSTRWIIKLDEVELSGQPFRGICVDASSNCYWNAMFESPISVGPTNLTSRGEEDAALVKQDAAGNLLWLQQIGGVGYDRCSPPRLDRDGNCYITGSFQNSVNIGSLVLKAAGSEECYVAKFNSAGQLLWAWQSTGENGYAYGRSIAVDDEGNSYITGGFHGGKQFGTLVISNTWETDTFVAKLNPAGEPLWVRTVRGSWYEQGLEISVDRNGSSYILGILDGQASFPGTNLFTLEPDDGRFLAKYDTAGVFQWAKVCEQAKHMVADTAGNTYVSGVFDQNLVVDAVTLSNRGLSDFFLAKWNSQGRLEWIHQGGTPNSETLYSLTLDHSNIVHATGTYYQQTRIGSSILPQTAHGMFAARFDPDGTARWAAQTGRSLYGSGANLAVVRALAVDPWGNLFARIKYEGALIVGDRAFTNVYEKGFFVASLRPEMTMPLITSGSAWRYLDTGVNLGTGWTNLAFNDSGWKQGSAQFGFGDGDEVTPINGGPTTNRFVTTYFRKSFEVDNATALTVSNLAVNLLRDDGAVVYLNGVEVFRSNMPEGPINYRTLASVAIGGVQESTYYPAPVPPELLRVGSNVIAVEVHQATLDSSDLSFDLELSANSPLGFFPPTITRLVPAHGTVLPYGEPVQLFVEAADRDGQIASVEFNDGGTNLVGVTTNGTLSFAWTNASPGWHRLVARAVDANGLMSPTVTNSLFLAATNSRVLFYPDFTIANGFILQVNAALTNSGLFVSSAQPNNRGAAWYDQRVGVAEGFETTFQFRITNRSANGGDGFAFVIQEAPFPQIAGAGGKLLGYGGITNSVAIEFDTYQNTDLSDPNNLHIGVHTRGTLPNDASESATLARNTTVANFADGNIHTVKISHYENLLKVYLDRFDAPVLMFTFVLTNTLRLNNGKAWIGFTSANGTQYQNNEIVSWYFMLPNHSPTIIMTEPPTATVLASGANLELAASASDTDGTIARVDFLANGQVIGSSASPPFRFTWTNVAAGNYTLAARARDDNGATSVSAPVTITANRLPVVSLVRPDAETVYIAPATIALVADATDPDGPLAQVEFFAGTNLLASMTEPPYASMWSNAAAGSYEILVRATDGLGFSATSAPVHIRVLAQPPAVAAPVIGTNSLGFNQRGLFGQTVTITNPTATPFPSVRIMVQLDAPSAASGVRVWNAAGTNAAGVPYVQHNQSLAPGQAVDLTIEYYIPDRRTVPSPTFTVEVVAAEADLNPAGTPLAIDRVLPMADGSVLVEFNTLTNRIYYLQYSADMVAWKTVLPSITGTGSRVQWFDNGPPKTESAPNTQTNRFYRVLLLP